MLSVIIPMYNEEAGCEKCIEMLDRSLSESFDNYEIVAVNDGSGDRTGEVLAGLKADFPHLTVCSYTENRGKGHAVRTGILSSLGDFVLYTDCDLAYGTKIIKEMYEKLSDSDMDILIGSRNLTKNGYGHYTFFRRLVSRLYIKTVCLFAGFDHTDSQCGIKCFRGDCAKKIFEKCTVDGFAFDLEALMIGEKAGFSVGEYPVEIVNHNQNSSKVHIFRDTLKMLADLVKIRKRIKNIEI